MDVTDDATVLVGDDCNNKLETKFDEFETKIS